MIKVIVKSYNHQYMVEDTDKSWKNSKNNKLVVCQICSKKGRSRLNCFNRINLSTFLPQHDRTLSSSGLTIRASANMTYEDGTRVWYPDSEVKNHKTYEESNIQDVKDGN